MKRRGLKVRTGLCAPAPIVERDRHPFTGEPLPGRFTVTFPAPLESLQGTPIVGVSFYQSPLVPLIRCTREPPCELDGCYYCRMHKEGGWPR